MWSELPLDMLILISKRLALDDFIIFSSVCRSWCYAYTVTKHNHGDEAPWLMYSGGEEEPNTAVFYDMSHKKELKIGNQPGRSLHKRLFLGSARGWLITADEKSELSLLNPFTRTQIDLPSVTTFGNFLPIAHDANGEVTQYRFKDGEDEVYDKVFTAEELRYFSYGKATLVCCGDDGKVEDNYTVAVLLPSLDGIAYARCGDKKWTTLTNCIQSREEISGDVNEAKVYTIIWSGVVECWDFSRKNHVPEREIYVPEDRWLGTNTVAYAFYLVQTPWGDIWHVRRRRKGYYPKGNYLTRKIWIYRVDFAKKKLIRVKSIGEYALFVGGNVPLCVSCKDNPNLKPNSVYFLDDFYPFDDSDRMRMLRKDIGIYCFDDRSIELIMPQNSLLKWPPPIWLQPPIL